MVRSRSLGISSIFAVYTFIGPFVTDAARLSPPSSRLPWPCSDWHGRRQPLGGRSPTATRAAG